MEVAKRKRIAAKGWLTRVSRQLEEILGTTDISELELSDQIIEFETRLRILDEAQSDVEAIIEIDELECDIENASIFREEKKSILLRARQKLSQIKQPQDDVDSCARSQTSSLGDSGVNTQLPKLELPKFSGDYTQWQTFWEKFRAVVDQSNIPDVNKFTYLQSVLQREAATSIRGLSLTSDNYSTAKDILIRRFGKPERIIFGHIQNLLRVNTKNADGSVAALWKLHDDIQINVRSLENLGVSGDTYGVILTPLILHQLPPNIRMEWARVGEEHEGDLDFLLKFLNNEIRRRERSQTFGSGVSPIGAQKTSFSIAKGYPERRSTAAALAAPTHKSVTVPYCNFCGEKHYSDQCPSVRELDFESRKARIKGLGLCFRCLGKHLAKDCNKTCYFCKDNHHSVLCKKRMKSNETGTKSVRNTVEPDGHSAHVGISFVKTESMTTIMQVVRSKINGIEVTIMFDSGSDRSFITKECAENLRLKVVGTECLEYCCFAGVEAKEEMKNVYELNVSGERIMLIGMNKICSTMFRSPVPEEILAGFKDIAFTEDFNLGRSVKVDILIGLDWYWPLIKSQSNISRNGVVAQETIFGWMLSGVYSQQQISQDRQKCTQSKILFCHTALRDDTVRRMWELESIGILDNGNEVHVENEKMLKAFNDEIQCDDIRYTVRLPWKSNEAKDLLLNNREQAEKRLLSLTRKFEKNRTLEERYNEVFETWEKDDIIQEVPIEERENDRHVFYLPHRPVIREESSSTKIRPVFDASSRGANGISLNDCMEAGPNMIPDLTAILVRFRRWKYGLTADITKAFLQIKVHKVDQDFHRFLWDVDGRIRTMKFNRVIFGNASSPFLLNATVKFHLSKFEPTKTVKELENNLYVDDWLTGADSEQEIHEMMKEAEDTMNLGGFPLTKWASNCQRAKDEFSKSFDGFKDLDTIKVLGLTWTIENDCFGFRAIPTEKGCLCTKRLLLSITARLFDPLGLLTPFTILLKILFQEAWRIGYDWDDVLPTEFQEQMRKWLNSLETIQEWHIPRSISLTTWTKSGYREILVFADASEKAYGCCVYLKISEGENCKVSLVMSKVKVAPLRKVTLPRLELLAALLAARLLKFTSMALEIESSFSYTCWTDSQIVLNWIRSDPYRWKQFVSNRVQEIHQHTNPVRWKHCSGKENPADLLTRGIRAEELMNSDLWLHGPIWLRKTDIESSQEKDEYEERELVTDEMLEEQRTGTVLTSASIDKRSPLIEYDRFSDFNKVVRIMSWIIRFDRNCKIEKGTERICNKDLSSEELEFGRNALLQVIQREFYSEELKDLKENRNLKRSSSIYKLSPCIGQDGLLRVWGRLNFAPSLLYDEKHPIILPKCHISYLIVKTQHSLMKHAGVNTLISTLRNTYWIVSLRTLAKKICKKCIDCQRQDARPCEQVTAPLPEDRIKKSPPFSVIGVDHAGPLFCSDLPDKKLYILLFTCAIVRAVHIELVESLSLEDFILAFKRFSARRGRPSVVYSDNAKTFKGACSLLQREMGHHTLSWKFSAPLSPWWGGWWERLIRSIKSSLRKSLGQALIRRVELETALHEIEACINSRPLTYVEESGVPLSPAHFLIGRSSPMSSTDVVEFCEEIENLGLRKECQSMVMEKFWETWRDNYIRNLPPMRVKNQNTKITTGAIVLVREDGKPRLKWPLGIVTKTFPGKDGFVRAVELKTNKGIIVRAIQKLHRLEMFQNEDIFVPPSFESNTTVSSSDVSYDNNQTTYTTKSGRKVKKNVKMNL